MSSTPSLGRLPTLQPPFNRVELAGPRNRAAYTNEPPQQPSPSSFRLCDTIAPPARRSSDVSLPSLCSVYSRPPRARRSQSPRRQLPSRERKPINPTGAATSIAADVLAVVVLAARLSICARQVASVARLSDSMVAGRSFAGLSLILASRACQAKCPGLRLFRSAIRRPLAVTTPTPVLALMPTTD